MQMVIFLQKCLLFRLHFGRRIEDPFVKELISWKNIYPCRARCEQRLNNLVYKARKLRQLLCANVRGHLGSLHKCEAVWYWHSRQCCPAGPNLSRWNIMWTCCKAHPRMTQNCFHFRYVV